MTNQEVVLDLAEAPSLAKTLGAGLAALSAVLAVIGVTGDRVSVILRNDAGASMAIFAGVAAAIGIGLFLNFIPEAASASVVVTAFLASLGPSAAAYFAPEVEARLSPSLQIVATLVASTLGVIAAIWLITTTGGAIEGVLRATIPRRLALAVVGLSLLGSSIYVAVKLEVVNQGDYTLPQLSVEYASGDEPSVKVTVQADKLTSDRYVTLKVEGFEGAAAEQAEKPCTHEPSPCVFLAGSILQPDVIGSVDQVLEVPVSDTIGHISVIAFTCRRGVSECDDVSAITTSDFRIP